MPKTGVRIVQVCLDETSFLILNRLSNKKPKNRSNTIRKLLRQAWAYKVSSRNAPKLYVGRKKSGKQYSLIKVQCPSASDFEGVVKE